MAATTAAPTAAAATAPGTAAGKVVWMVRTTPAENQGQAKIFLPAIKKAYPDITVDRIIVPSTDYIPKIYSMAAAKTQLDIWGFGGNYMGYWAQGMVQGLDSYIGADKWDVKSYFYPGFSQSFNVFGHQYGLPQQTTYGSVMVYNKNLLDSAGLSYPPVDWTDTSWTFDKLLAYAQKTTKDFGTPNAQYGVNWGLWPEESSISYLYGEDSWLPETYTNYIAPKSNFATPGNIQGHQLRHDYIYKYKVHPDPSMTKAINQLGDPFLSGKVALELDGGWLYWTTFDISDFKYGFAAVPSITKNKTVNFTDFWIMGNWSPAKDDAWKVLRVLTDTQPVIDYSVFAGSPPAVVAATDAWIASIAKRTGQSTDDLKKVTLGAIDPSRSQQSPDHLFISHDKIDNTYTQIIAPFWADAGTTAQQAWPSITKQMDATMAGIYAQFNGKLPTS
jgi:multiple sugar transport system substrate-binding protein